MPTVLREVAMAALLYKRLCHVTQLSVILRQNQGILTVPIDFAHLPVLYRR